MSRDALPAIGRNPRQRRQISYTHSITNAGQKEAFEKTLGRSATELILTVDFVHRILFVAISAIVDALHCRAD